MIPLLEVCVDSLESALAAQQGGADRLELCGNLSIGGTTPSPALVEAVVAAVDIPVNVLLRPRFGDFLFTEAEKAQLLREVELIRGLGVHGLVLGALRADGTLDAAHLRQAMTLGGSGLAYTLHRAFDVCRDPFEALETAVALGFSTILTSGQAATAPEGAALLGELVERAGERIAILAGSGVSAASVPALSRVGVRQFHASAKKTVDGPMAFRRGGVPMGLPLMDEYARTYTDAAQVAAIRAAMAEMAVETCTNSPKAL